MTLLGVGDSPGPLGAGLTGDGLFQKSIMEPIDSEAVIVVAAAKLASTK